MKFTKFESSLYLAIAEVFDSDSNLHGHEYSDGYRSGNVLIGHEPDPIHVIFSFPNNSDDCYIMISDGDPDQLAKEVAALQEYNDTVAHLCKNHTVPTESEYLNNSGWFSYLITTPKITYSDFPNSLQINGREIRFHLALPLTEVERDIKINNGIEALLDKFEDSNRDTISFN